MKSRRDIAPRSHRSSTDVALSTWMRPAQNQSTGGDWCESVTLSDDLVAFSIGDACGHGFSAAHEMVILRDAFAAGMRESFDPMTRIRKANRVAYDIGAAPATAIAGLFNVSRRVLTFANAGHPPPLVVDAGGSAFLARRTADMPLGIDSEYASEPFIVSFEANALFVFYTDGVTEHERDAIAGEARLRQAAVEAYQYPERDAALGIAAAMNLRSPLHDDAVVFTIRAKR